MRESRLRRRGRLALAPRPRRERGSAAGRGATARVSGGHDLRGREGMQAGRSLGSMSGLEQESRGGEV
jgi:hypothetical protein